MEAITTQSGLRLDTQRQYRDNFARHVLGVALYIQAEVMNALTRKHGHSKLRLNFEPYITLAGSEGARLSDIADVLGISRQAAGQTANQIEAAGYLQRACDPRDGRAKLLTRTPRAKALVKQGAEHATWVQTQLAGITGDTELATTTLTLARLNRELGLLLPQQNTKNVLLAVVLPRLSDYISNRLQKLTMARGHSGLKRSFGSVLMSIGPQGGRIQQIADAHDVSKQAISAIAVELEDLNYIQRRTDPQDARQVVLVFTAAGYQLIEDSVASSAELYRELADLVGEATLREAATCLATLYQSLQLGEDVFGDADTNNIGAIARQLTRQLGDEGAQALARLILTSNSDPHAEVAT